MDTTKNVNFTHYNVILLNSARKNLRKIPHQEQLKILEKLSLLIKNHKLLDIKKLKDFQELYRIRSGKYCIVYRKDANKLIFLIAIICHRQEVYQRLNALVN